jgi:P4 family phage/plasmid primase-like protien
MNGEAGAAGQSGLPGWLQHPFKVTFFQSFGATAKQENMHTLQSLAAKVQNATASSKQQLPWLKLGLFGDAKTDKGSLRHDSNLHAITGIEADYDGERVGFDAAVETAIKADLLALIYTSPSHSQAQPRWRVLCPTSQPMLPGQRSQLLGRLNGAFGGIFSAESWTLSQAYYYGSVARNPDHRVYLVDGTPIDQLSELDELWRGKPNANFSPGITSTACHGPIDEAALLEEIRSGASYHTAAVRLLGRWARTGVAYMQAKQRLVDAMLAVFPPDRDSRWQQRFDDIDRCLEDIYVKEAAAKDRDERAAASNASRHADGPSEEEEPASDGEVGIITEDRVAAALVHRYGNDLRYCHHAGKWYRWNSSIWQREDTKLAFSWIRKLARDMAARTDEAKVIVSAGKAAFSAGAERLAQADRAFAVTSAVWDQDPWLLGTPEGTVDLRNGELRPPRQEDLISRSTAISPAPQLECPTWLAFLEQACAGDQDLIGFLQRWFGYCLTGVTQEHALLFVYGPGGNGKGVLLVTIAGILGTYAANAAMDTFTASQGDRHPTDLAMLHGARMVMTTETEEGRAWAEARIKALTGGDPITARFMRQDFFTFTPAFKLTISGNHKPALRNVDDAARRRFNVVPFLHKPQTPDKQLPEKLQAEWPGILRWLIDGCLAWQREGLVRPKVVLEATAEYFAEQDILAQWIEESCEQGTGHGDTNANLFASWRAFAQSRAEEPRNAKWFGTMLERQGFRRDKDCELFRGRGFIGIRVKPEAIPRHWQDPD